MRVAVQERYDRWRRITLGADEDGMIRLDAAGLTALEAALETDDRVVVLQGSGDAFCHGLDLRAAVDGAAEQVQVGTQRFARVLEALASRLSIAVVDGAVVAGGVALVAACTHAVASPRSTFALPETTLGLVPALVLATLLRRMGPGAASRVGLWASATSADRAVGVGLIDEIAEAPESVATALARTWLRCRPETVHDTRSLAWQLSQAPPSERMSRAAQHTARALVDPMQRAWLRGWLDGELPPWFGRGAP